MHFLGLPIYFFSVRIYPKVARNPNSIRTPAVINGTTIYTNGMANGHSNHAFNDDEMESIKKKKRPAPIPPESPELNQALKALDDVLFSESVNSRDVCEENVVALVHRANSVVEGERKASIREISLNGIGFSVVEEYEEQHSESILVPTFDETVKIFDTTPPQNSEEQTKPPSPPPQPSSPLHKSVDSFTVSIPSPSLIEDKALKHHEEESKPPPPPPLPSLDLQPPKTDNSFKKPPPFVNLRKPATLSSLSSITQDIKEFEKVALKPVKSVASSKQIEEPPPDSHLRFGSKQHENFKRKLEGVFQNNVPTVQTYYKRPATVHGNNFIRKTIEPLQKPLEHQQIDTEGNVSFKDVKSKFERTLNINPVKLEHSRRMASTLQSIRQRKFRSMPLELGASAFLN